MATGTVLEINGVPVKDPSAYAWEWYDLSSEDVAGRAESGQNNKDIIAQKVKLTLQWDFLTFAEAATILRMSVGGNLSAPQPYLSVKYFDIARNAWRTMTATVGDRTAPMYNFTLGRVENVAFNLIER